MTDATDRFSNRVADYVKARPGYPAGVIDTLRERVQLGGSCRVADVGAGTGIFTRQLLEAGASVIAVEPNDPMRAAIAPHPRLQVVAGRAEATTLPVASVDIVTAAQAFHWFDRSAFRAECRRILRPGGRVAILFNDRPTGGSPFLDGYERLLEQHAIDYAAVNHRRLSPAVFDEFYAPHRYERLVFPNVQQFDYDGVEARLLSSSYAPPAADPRSAALLAALRELFDATHERGTVAMRYETQLWIGEVA